MICKHFKDEWEELKRYTKATMTDEFVSHGFNPSIGYEELLQIEKEVNAEPDQLDFMNYYE